MKQHYLIKNGHQHLLLFFAGWGMDENPFRETHPMDCDWMICYDYRSLTFDETLIKGYSHITLVAWSMGVWAASQVMKEHPTISIAHSTAINGTVYPVNETLGINPTIFEGTLQGLNELTWQKFQRRMCGSVQEYKAFQAISPQRTVDELKEELTAIQKQSQSLPPALRSWHKAIIGINDAIFPPQNQRLSWASLAHSVEEVETAHYQAQLFQKIIQHNPQL